MALGVILGQKGQLDEAIREFQEGLRLKPDDVDAHNHLGNTLSRKGRADEAIEQFREALRLQPDNADARRNLDGALAAKAHASQASGGATNSTLPVK